MDMTTRCTELKPSPAEVIPIDRPFKKRSQEPANLDIYFILPMRKYFALGWKGTAIRN